MKNKFIILTIISMLTIQNAFAVQEGKVVSDSATKKNVTDAFNEVNKATDGFFTPSAAKVIAKKEQVEIEKKQNNPSGFIYPVKRLRLRIQNRNNPKQEVVEEVAPENQAILDCDTMEYFAERTELEANGHAVMFFPKNNSSIKADKLVYNQATNFVKAFGNVVLTNNGKEMSGDYMQIDLNEENALMDEPVTELWSVKAVAKKGYLYGDKMIQEQGVMKVIKKTKIDVTTEMFGPNLDNMYVNEWDKAYFSKESSGSKFKIKTNEIYINSKKEHDDLTLKHAEIYYNGKKIGTIPGITMHTDKHQSFVEANFPEFGTKTGLGLYAGPGFVFDTPGGTTLKVLPILNYQSNAEDSSDNKLGWGGIAKFRSASNRTDMAYGTSNGYFIFQGIQKLDDDLYFQYGSNSYLDDWFLGMRMPKLMGELVYQPSNIYKDFLGKDKDMTFTQRIAGAWIQDGSAGNGFSAPGYKWDENGESTMRFQYMTEVAQTVYKLNDVQTSPFNARLEIVGQGAASLYGTGDTQMVGRIGPRIHTQYKYWMQDIGYFLSAYNDQTPLVHFDQYMYGRSNVYFRESLRLTKYFTLSWFASLNMSNDAWDGNMFQENTFYFSFGPDDVKINIGYDTVRQQSYCTLAMHLDAKGSTVEYKKLVVKNPDKVGKDPKNKNESSFSPASESNKSEEDTQNSIERAEVINISQVVPGET